MRKASAPNALSGSRMAAYGCVGMATAFVMALTLGLFDQTETPRHVADNSDVSATFSTP